MRLALVLLTLVCAPLLGGCAGAPERPEPTFTPEVAPVGSNTAPEAREAAQLLLDKDYAEAADQYVELYRYELAPMRRAEFLFFAGEAALADGDAHAAYEHYKKLLETYPTTPRYGLVVERLYLIGERFAEGRATKPTWLLGLRFTDRAFGIEVLEAFQRARERHPLADDALYLVGEARLVENEPEEAIGAWQKVVDEYPRSEWAETAEWRIGLAFVEMSSGPEYDKQPILEGLRRLRGYVDRHPTGNHIAEATEKIKEVEEGLAEQELDVVRYYLRWNRRYSAQLYLEAIRRDYPKTASAAEALRLLNSLPKTSPPAAEPDPEENVTKVAPPPPTKDPLATPYD